MKPTPCPAQPTHLCLVRKVALLLPLLLLLLLLLSLKLLLPPRPEWALRHSCPN